MTADRAVQNLIASYAFHVDDGDFAAMGALFADAAYVLNGVTLSGSDAVEQFARQTLKVHDDGTPRTRHMTTNLFIDADEQTGTAVSRSYFTVFQAVEGFPLQPIASGQYRDRFERRRGQWRFIERAVTTDLIGDVRHHARMPAR